MRYQEIMELSGVKRFKDMTSRQVVDYIENNLGTGSIKILGRGAFGVAVMIGQSVYKFWLSDSAYTDYVKYCLTHTDNPCLPKFLSSIKTMPAFFKKHADAPSDIQYIKMEMLSQVSINNLDIIISSKSKKTVSIRTISQIVQRQKGNKDNIISAIVDLTLDWAEVNISNFNQELVLLIDTFIDINKLIEQNNNHLFDINDSNMMQRGTQLVILDPIANIDDLRLSRMFNRFDDIQE